MAKKKVVNPDEDFSVKEEKAGLFDILKNISESETYMWNEFSKSYSPYMVNKFLSMHTETVFFANEMNKADLSPQAQYEFYFYGLPKKRRYFKFINKSKEDNVLKIMDVMQYSRRKALQTLNNLHEEL